MFKRKKKIYTNQCTCSLRRKTGIFIKCDFCIKKQTQERLKRQKTNARHKLQKDATFRNAEKLVDSKYVDDIFINLHKNKARFNQDKVSKITSMRKDFVKPFIENVETEFIHEKCKTNVMNIYKEQGLTGERYTVRCATCHRFIDVVVDYKKIIIK